MKYRLDFMVRELGPARMRRGERYLAMAITVLCFGLGSGIGAAMATQPIRSTPSERERAMKDVHAWQSQISRSADPQIAPFAGVRARPFAKRDPWGRDYLWLEQASIRGEHCILSTGHDGQLGTEDDVVSGCYASVLNQYRLVHVGLDGDEGAKDYYGHPIRFIREGRQVLVWSYGQDGVPDTADDQMARFSASAVKSRGR